MYALTGPQAVYPPKVAVSNLVNSLKDRSTRRIRQEFTGHLNRAIMPGHLWSPSHFSASYSGALLAIVRQYIKQQKAFALKHMSEQP
ncbi:transposase [Streptomyces chartreusis]|uniref:transposase n=1 Tax=Streptomyces chartreusis TaxID=1969 RepID=UPI002F912FAC|nr:transposase [Streptomyces chartreusis]WTA33568.1 transposase [Streptomyces chartreusis]